MALFNEETFGPVVVIRFREESMSFTRQRHAVWWRILLSRDIARIWRVATGSRRASLASTKAHWPASGSIGGIKESGYGREGSRYGLDDYMHTKYLSTGNSYDANQTSRAQPSAANRRRRSAELHR